MFLGRESDEGKAAWPPGGSIDRDVNVYDFAYLGQELSKLLVCDAEVEIAYEYLV